MKLGGWVALGAALVVVGCVSGDDKSDAATQGSLGGPCFANNTCNTGLVCTLVNGKGICEASDATTQDAPADTTTSDVLVDSPADTSSDVDAGCNPQITAPCANQQCHQQTKVCCEKTGTCGLSAADCNSQAQSPYYDCTGTPDCLGGYVCCATGALNTSTCPYNLQSTTQAICTSGACAQGTYQLCLSSADCSTGAPTCMPVNVDNHVFGFCF